MNRSRWLMKGGAAGLLSGVWLGLLFKAVEMRWDIRVYTLLLNVDYIPVLKEFSFPEIVEFSFHLLISVVLAMVLLYAAERRRWTNQQRLWNISGICLFIGLLLYPTTALSERTPPFDSVSAFMWWQLGHLLYGAVLGLFYWKRN